MEGVIVIGIVPIDCPWRYETFLVGGGRISHRLDRRLLDLRIVSVQLAVFRDDVFPSIGDQEVIEQGVRIVACRVQLEAHPVDIAHALRAQLLMHFFEKVVVRIPGFRSIFDVVTRFLDERPPDVVRPHRAGKGHGVIATPFLDAVVTKGGEQRRFGVLRFLRLDDVAHIDQLAVPGKQGDDFGGRVLEQVRHDAAGHCRNDLLAHRRIRRDAVIDLVAARLLIVGDDLLEGDVFLLGKALDPPRFGGFGGGMSDIRPHERARGCERQRTTKHRTPGWIRHFAFLPFHAASQLNAPMYAREL